MSNIQHTTILAVFIFIALVCYGYGFHTGANLAFFAGIIFESIFWLLIFASGKKRSTS